MQQLRASGEVKTLEAAVIHARLLIAVDSQPVAAELINVPQRYGSEGITWHS